MGDIKSVITNFVEALIDKLYGGQSVNIKDFGVFSLSARTVGVEKKEDCTAKNIKAVKINFRPSTTIRPDVTATRAGQKIDFYDLEAWKTISHYAFALSHGHTEPFFGGSWIENPEVAITCCNDGIRPVVFKMETANE